jgi:DNA polymerase-3 subunit beta
MYTINRKLLVDNLQNISGPTQSKSTFPIFSSVLIDIQGNKISLTTTDLEMTMITEIEQTQSTKQESFCVSHKKFLSILKEFNTEIVTLKIEKNFLWIICENSEFKLNILPKEEFPKIPFFKDKHALKFKTEEINEMIEKTSFCVFVGEGSYILNGILCEIEKNHIRLISTDGKRLALIEKQFPSDQAAINDVKKFIIPSKSIIELSKLLKSQEDEFIYLISGKNQIGIDFSSIQFISQLIEGEFPDYQKYLLKESDNKCVIERASFMAALKRANLLTSSDFQGVRLLISKNKLLLSKVTPNMGEYKEELEIEYNGKEISLGFNPEYLLDLLRVVEEEKMVFELFGEEKPLIFRGKGYVYLALPMRMK